MQCNREGTFRAQPLNWGVKQADSGAIGFQLTFALLYEYKDGAWQEIATEQMECDGAFWLIKKNDGGINQTAIEQCMDSLGWDGDFASLQANDWSNSAVNVTVKAEEYNGKTRYKAAFINPPEDTPRGGTLSNADASKLEAFNDRWGAQIRALRGERGPVTPSGIPLMAVGGAALFPAGDLQEDIPF